MRGDHRRGPHRPGGGPGAGERWRGPPRRPPAKMMWRFGGMFGLFLLASGGLTAAGVWALLTAVGVGSPSGVLRGVAIAVLVLGFFGGLALGRIARRTAVPVGALIEATGQIEEGDYTARVPERGPRELRRLARTFNGMSERLELVDAGRRAFLADVAHELRTPLTVIQGRIEAMLDGVDPRDDDQLERVLAHAKVMDRLVEDVRTVALAETGSLELRREPTDAALLLRDVAADFSDAPGRDGVEIRVEVAAGVPPLAVDPARVRQVLANLLTNALRHTHRGDQITMSAQVASADADADAVTIAVTDTGDGISDELLGRVFERFAKGAGSPGVGLGLAIARDIVEAHGGTVSAQSVEGEGTTIALTLPISGG